MTRSYLRFWNAGCTRVLAALLFVGLAIGTAWAQDEDDKGEIAVVAEEVQQDERPSLKDEEQAPMRSFAAERRVESLKKLDEGIVQIREILRRTPQTHPQRGEFLFNLAELFWEKSKYYEQRHFETLDQCHQLTERGDERGAQNCRRQMDEMMTESRRLREESVQLYVDIIRNHPDFSELDKVYYYLGANLMEVGKREEALDIFRRLINDYPRSSYVPNVLLAFGDYYFDKEDMQQALRAYQRLGDYPRHPVYAYARYKEAWCHFNLDRRDRALETFINVLEVGRRNNAAESLMRQTRRDIVLTYSHVGAPDRAMPFFQRIAADESEALEMGERLAILYGDRARFEDSIRMYRELIRLNQESIKTVSYQTEIVRNTTTINSYSTESVNELIRLMRFSKLAEEGHFKDKNQEEWLRERDRVEALVRQWSTTYHREAQQTRNPDLYAMAYFLYQNYLDTFPTTESEYQMQFFYGELLYKLQKWEEAAEAYERVLEIDPKGQYTNESVHALVLSYFKIVNTSEEQAQLNRIAEAAIDDSDDDTPAVIPEPKPIPDIHQRLLRACKLYTELNPDGDRIVDVKYTKARAYYDFDHHEDAIRVFKDIAYSHSDHRLAVIAANLHLDSLNVLQRFDDLHEAVVEYLEKRPINDGPFIDDLVALNASIRFKKCTILDDEEKWRVAAQCFVDFYRDFPDSEHVDKALYNAALDFERMREIGKAIQVRIFLLRERPDSELAPETLYNIGGNYHALAVYSEAARFYEMYAQAYPKLEDAQTALANASTFRHGLGELDQAIKNYEQYLENYGSRDMEKSAEVFFQIAKIHEERDDNRQAFEQYQNYLRRFARHGTLDNKFQAQVKIGLHHWNQGQRSRREALKVFNEILRDYNRLGQAEREAMTTGRDAVAQARFMIGEDVFEKMAAIQIDSPNEDVLRRRLQEKMAVAEEAKEIFESVILFGRPDWAIAALYRIGSGFQNFADAIRNSPPPPRLTEDQKEIYAGILEDNAVQIDALAVDAYTKALDVARESSWFNDYSRRAEVALAQLRPREFRRPSELRAQPDNFSAGFTRVEFIKTLEEEDRLTDFAGVDTSGPTTQR